MKNNLLLVPAALALFAIAPAAWGQVAIYDFDSSTPSASSVAANLLASDISGGAGISAFAYDAGNPSSGKALSATKWGLAFDTSDYFELTLNPDSGFTLTLTAFQMDTRRSPTGPTTWELRSSLDSYASSLGGASPGDGTFAAGQTVDLSGGASFVDLSSPVTFRVFAYGATSSAGTFRIDNLKFDGSVAPVPEPAGWAMLGGLMLLGYGVTSRITRGGH